MSGGMWVTQNKVRPGAYINFVSVPRPTFTLGDRGIATIPLELDWGAENTLINVYSDDFLGGESVPLIGYSAFDAEAKLLRPMLSSCYLVKVFRLNPGGTKASVVHNGLTVTAKYNGKFGNELAITVEIIEGLARVTTWARGNSVDVQNVTKIGELDDNGFVTFSGDPDQPPVTTTAGMPLEGGTNGTVNESTAYAAYTGLLRKTRWNAVAVPTGTQTVKSVMTTFLEQMWKDEGRYVQGVISEYNTADHFAVISNKNSVALDGENFTNAEATAIIAGLSGGVVMTQSLTNMRIRGATRIIGELSNTEIIEALQDGFIVFSANEDGSIKIEQDINTLRTFTPERNASFRKNRVVRVMAEWGSNVKNLWESSFMGKVDNGEDGRALFKAEVIGIGNEFQRLGAIEGFDGVEDIDVRRGTEIDAVVADAGLTIIDAMEKLYLTNNLYI